jgi:RimJ/RimL family protein N-acetyltransferase
VAELEAEYGPSIDGTDPTGAYVVVSGARDIGFIQCYRVADHPAHERRLGVAGAIGIDYFIGEPALIGQGVGTRMIGEFVRTIVRRRYPEAAHVVADPEVANAASCRALEKNGFTRRGIVAGEHGDEQVMVLDLTLAAQRSSHT